MGKGMGLMLEEFVRCEFEHLNQKYGNAAIVREVNLDFLNRRFFNDFKKTILNDRRGEVVFFTQLKNQKFVLVRREFYPKNIYRVPTGGINFDERAEDALFREIEEELGIVTSVDKFLGLIEYCVNFDDEKLKFYSYIFKVTEQSGEILKDATEDEIHEYIEADKQIISENVNRMFSVEDKWKDWCSFRANSTGFILFNE